MKAMMLSEFLVTKRALLRMFVIYLIVGLIIGFAADEMFAVSAAMGAMLPMIYFFTVSSYDDRNDWKSFRQACPVSRNGVVLGRYLALLVVSLVAVLVAIVLNLAFMMSVDSLNIGLPVSGESVAFTSENIALVASLACVGFALSLVICAIVIPLVFRFGMTKAVQMIPLLIGILVVVGISLSIDGRPLAGLVSGFWDASIFGIPLASPEGVAIASLVAGAVLYAVSAVVSCRFYRKREL